MDEGSLNMLQENSGNNIVSLTGKIVSEPVFSHEVFNEGFYNINLEVARLSQTYDVLPVTVSERIMDRDIFTAGSFLCLTGSRHNPPGRPMWRAKAGTA